jgi:hypothetical protein
MTIAGKATNRIVLNSRRILCLIKTRTKLQLVRGVVHSNPRTLPKKIRKFKKNPKIIKKKIQQFLEEYIEQFSV